MSELSKQDIREIADAAADRAVAQTFRTLGIDVTRQEDINDLRADLIYSRKLRRITEGSTTKAWFVLVMLTTVGLATFIWHAIKTAVGVDP